jgi:hypothetical protein
MLASLFSYRYRICQAAKEGHRSTNCGYRSLCSAWTCLIGSRQGRTQQTGSYLAPGGQSQVAGALSSQRLPPSCLPCSLPARPHRPGSTPGAEGITVPSNYIQRRLSNPYNTSLIGLPSKVFSDVNSMSCTVYLLSIPVPCSRHFPFIAHFLSILSP